MGLDILEINEATGTLEPLRAQGLGELVWINLVLHRPEGRSRLERLLSRVPRERGLLVGGGGHAKVCSMWRARPGFLLPASLIPIRRAASGEVQRLGGDEAAQTLRGAGAHPRLCRAWRQRAAPQVGERLRAQGFELATLVHPSAVWSRRAPRSGRARR